MEAKSGSAPVTGRMQLIASPWHTALVLAVQISLSVRGYVRSGQMRGLVNPDRISLYGHTIFFQWMVFALVIVGLRLRGTSLYALLGERWRSVHQLITDVGISFLLLVASIMVPAIFGPHSQSTDDLATQFLLPRSGSEIAGWIALSLTAGLCEEVLFRGYLQQQFRALTNNAAIGILSSAVLFGAAHGYQGHTKAMLIGFTGAILGAAAYWRKSTRPGMLAHAAQDLLGGLIRHG
jgi:membrane protease YdiL (CAAX protease family)